MALLFEGSSYHNPVLDIKSEAKREKVLAVTRPFILTKQTVERLRKTFEDEMDHGLEPKETAKKTCLQMECTFVTALPDGQESGDFLAIDLGSTNFRVLLSRLNPGGEDEFAVKYYDVPAEYRQGESANLFDFLAACIADFISERPELLGARLPLGFTFSYPVVQEGITAGFLVTWTKSYDLPDAIGKNAVQLLSDAMARRGDLNVEVVAILNDTTGTLVKGAYLEKDCAIGMILGSGFNACFLEKVERIHKLTANQRANLGGASEVIVDIECGAFGDNGCIDYVKTDIDREIDNESLFTNSFSFEKMFSGNFLGDVTRRVLLSLTKQGALFDGVVMSGLRTKDSFRAADAVRIEEAIADNQVRDVIQVVGYKADEISAEDVAIVRYVVSVVAIRGAILAATLLSSLLDRMAKEEATVAIDGSLYKHHPKMHKLLTDFISVLSPGRKFKLILAEDGSGKGAGLVAAAASKQVKS